MLLKVQKVFEEKGGNNGCVQGVGFIIEEEGILQLLKAWSKKGSF